MKKAFLFWLLLCTAPGYSHTGGDVEFTCPIDGNKFSSYQDFSGTSFGARLDLKKIGPIAQPWALPDCPKCHFVFAEEDASKKTIEELKPFILSEAYQKSGSEPSYCRLALIQEFQKASAFEIAFSYLRASWQTEDDQKAYANNLTRSLSAFSQASAELKEVKGRYDDYLISRYLPIEILRRLSRFDEASQNLSKYPEIKKTEIEWLPQVLRFQKKLIEQKDAGEHEIGEAIDGKK